MNPVIRGWVNFFALVAAQTHMQRLDEWTRRRLRQLCGSNGRHRLQTYEVHTSFWRTGPNLPISDRMNYHTRIRK
ncbi:MAG: hypothetical protein GY762_21015 [Proteobacteria bacterium]|nr:hypothetical protein [Pseudomonadota bacterium]